MSAVLSARGLRAGYGPVEVLHGVDLDVPPAAITAVVGRNGAGKTTLLRCLAGMLDAGDGRMRLDGREVSGWPTYRRAQAGLLFVPDTHGVFGSLTVEENLLLFAGNRPLDPAIRAFPVLGQRRKQAASTLSGGEQQMLALTPALLRPFRILLVDELGRGLAPQVAGRLYGSLRTLAAGGTAILLVEQDLRAVRDLVHYVHVLRRGQSIFSGELADLPTASH